MTGYKLDYAAPRRTGTIRTAEEVCATPGCTRAHLAGDRYCLACANKRDGVRRLYAMPGPGWSDGDARPAPLAIVPRKTPAAGYGSWALGVYRNFKWVALLVFFSLAGSFIFINLFPGVWEAMQAAADRMKGAL